MSQCETKFPPPPLLLLYLSPPLFYLFFSSFIIGFSLVELAYYGAFATITGFSSPLQCGLLHPAAGLRAQRGEDLDKLKARAHGAGRGGEYSFCQYNSMQSV